MVEFDPRDEKRLLLVVAAGRSYRKMVGRHFANLHQSSAAQSCRALRPDPEIPNRIWMATDDGLLKGDNAGKSFTGVGGLMFTGSKFFESFGRRSGEIYITSEDECGDADRGESWVMLPSRQFAGSKCWRSIRETEQSTHVDRT